MREVPDAVEVDGAAAYELLAEGLAVLPPIVVRDELEAGILVEVARLPELVETFYALTLRRRFPNPLVKLLLDS